MNGFEGIGQERNWWVVLVRLTNELNAVFCLRAEVKNRAREGQGLGNCQMELSIRSERFSNGYGRVWSAMVGLSSVMVRLTNKSNAVLPPRRAGDVGEGQGGVRGFGEVS